MDILTLKNALVCVRCVAFWSCVVLCAWWAASEPPTIDCRVAAQGVKK